MQVLLERIPTGVRATTDALGERISAEGADDAEALHRLEVAFTQFLPEGARLVEWPAPNADERPWMKFAGALKDEPLFDDWQESIRRYRANAE